MDRNYALRGQYSIRAPLAELELLDRVMAQTGEGRPALLARLVRQEAARLGIAAPKPAENS